MDNEHEFSICYKYDKEQNDPIQVLKALSALLLAFSNLERDIAQTIDSDVSNSLLLKKVEDGSIILKLLSKIIIPIDGQLTEPPKNEAVVRYIKGASEKVFSTINRTTSEKPDIFINSLKSEIHDIAKKEGISDGISYSSIGDLALVRNINSIIDVTSMTNENEKLFINQNVNNNDSNVELAKGTIIPIEPFLEKEVAETIISKKRLLVRPKIIDLLGNQKWTVIFDNKSFDVKISDLSWLETIHAGSKKIGANDLIDADFEITTHYDAKSNIISTEHTILYVYP